MGIAEKLRKVNLFILIIIILIILSSGCVNPPAKDQTTPSITTSVPTFPYYDIPEGYEYMHTGGARLYDPGLDKAYVQIEAVVFGAGERYYDNLSNTIEQSFQVYDDLEYPIFVTAPLNKINGSIKEGTTVKIYGYYNKDTWFEGINKYGSTIRQPRIFAHNVTVIKPAPAPTPIPTPVILRTLFDIDPEANYTSTSVRTIYSGVMDLKNVEIIAKVFNVQSTTILKDGDGVEMHLIDFQVWGNALSYGDPLYIETLTEKINGTVREDIMVRIKGLVSDKWEAGEPKIYAQYVEVIPEKTQ